MTVLLGIDVGTSATKSVLIDEHGRVLASGSAEHAISLPQEGWSEQDPEWWWRSVVESVREVLSRADVAEVARGSLGGGRVTDAIAAIGLSGQMHGSVFLPREALEGDGSGAKALRPALLWNDQRTAAQCAAIEARVGGRRRLVELAGNAALAGFTLPKYLWLREHEAALATRVAAVLMPKDFVRLRMTGIAATDVGDASGTLLFDVGRRAWNEGVMALLGIDPGMWPRVMESSEIAGRVTRWAAGELGVREGVPVMAGSGDNMCGAAGAGVVEPGRVAATLGTSGVIYAHTDSARPDLPADVSAAAGRTHAMCAGTGHAGSRAGWCITGCMLSAAGSLRWARDTIAPGESFDALLREAAEVQPGCEGLTFLPYLTGERCPYPDPAAKGGWIGLTARHTRAHLIRSVVEGVTFGMGQILELVSALDPAARAATAIRIGGGGTRSPLWRQVQADVYGRPLELPNTEEGPAFGAALMAGVGAGVWPDLARACGTTLRVTTVAEPSAAGAAALGDARRRYAKLYPALRGI